MSMKNSVKKDKLELLTDNDILMMVEKKDVICHAVYRYSKANNKYMNSFDKDNESSYIQYLDANNLYGWAMFQKLPLNAFSWKRNIHKFNKNFIKNYDKDSNKGYILEVDVEYFKNLLNFHGVLPFLAERKKIKKCNKLVCKINDKENYNVHIRTLKRALNHGIILLKVYGVIQFNQQAWLILYIDIDAKLTTEAKNDFENYFFKLINNFVFATIIKNVRKHRDIKLVTTNKIINQLVSEPTYHTTKWFSENLLPIEMKQIK